MTLTLVFFLCSLSLIRTRADTILLLSLPLLLIPLYQTLLKLTMNENIYYTVCTELISLSLYTEKLLSQAPSQLNWQVISMFTNITQKHRLVSASPGSFQVGSTMEKSPKGMFYCALAGQWKSSGVLSPAVCSNRFHCLLKASYCTHAGGEGRRSTWMLNSCRRKGCESSGTEGRGVSVYAAFCSSCLNLVMALKAIKGSSCT